MDDFRDQGANPRMKVVEELIPCRVAEKAEKGGKGPKRERPQRTEPCDARALNEMGDLYQRT